MWLHFGQTDRINLIATIVVLETKSCLWNRFFGEREPARLESKREPARLEAGV